MDGLNLRPFDKADAIVVIHGYEMYLSLWKFVKIIKINTKNQLSDGNWNG